MQVFLPKHQANSWQRYFRWTLNCFWFLLIFFAIINNVMNILMHVYCTTWPIISINHKPKSDIPYKLYTCSTLWDQIVFLSVYTNLYFYQWCSIQNSWGSIVSPTFSFTNVFISVSWMGLKFYLILAKVRETQVRW